MKYKKLGTVDRIYAGGSGRTLVNLFFEGESVLGQSLWVTQEETIAERVTIGDRIWFGWEPEHPAEREEREAAEAPDPVPPLPLIDLDNERLRSHLRLALALCGVQAIVIVCLLAWLFFSKVHLSP